MKIDCVKWCRRRFVSCLCSESERCQVSYSLEELLSGSDENPRPRKVVLYGGHGLGKSTWAARCPYGPVVFLPTEDGYQDLDPPVKVLTFNKKKTIITEGELHEAIALLVTNQHNFGCAVVDSAEGCSAIFDAKIVEDANTPKVKTIADIGFGKGQKVSAEKFRFFLQGLDALNASGMFVIVLAHAEIERFNDPAQDPYDRYTLRLAEGSSSILQEWADEVFFVNYKVYTKQVDEGFGKKGVKAVGSGERIMYTTERPTHDAKNRLGLPDAIPFDWDVYQKAVAGELASV